MQYFGEPEERGKIQMTSKNLQRYYTLKCFRFPIILLAKIFDLSRGRGNKTSTNMVVTWCLRTYIGLRPYMVNVYIKERINDKTTIWAGGVTGNTTYLGQISCDICTRFARYLYSTKKSWIINFCIKTY